MKKISWLILIMISGSLYSCKKSSVANSGAYSLNVIQAVSNAPSVYVYFSTSPANFYLQQTPLPSFSNMEYSNVPGAIPIEIVSADDTSNSLFRGTFDFKPGSMYSLYLIGNNNSVDTFFMKETFPYYSKSDSVAGIRFINLSPGSMPISINLQGNISSQTEFTDLGYKQIGTFRQYPATNNLNGSYTFEIRDQASGNLLNTIMWNFTLFQNNTIVIYGSEQPGSQTPINAFLVNNF